MLFEFNKTRYGKKSVPHTDMDGVQFCLRALSKDRDERRNHVKRLYVKGGEMVATDGNRLHKYTMGTEIPDGYYRPLINIEAEVIIYHEKDNDAEYPNYKSLLKIPKDCVAENLCFAENGLFASYAIILRTLTEQTLRFDYLKALGNDIFNLFITRDADNGERGVLLVNSKKTALVMGMRM